MLYLISHTLLIYSPLTILFISSLNSPTSLFSSNRSKVSNTPLVAVVLLCLYICLRLYTCACLMCGLVLLWENVVLNWSVINHAWSTCEMYAELFICLPQREGFHLVQRLHQPVIALSAQYKKHLHLEIYLFFY